MEKHDEFSESWKNAFDNAKVTPSPQVWEGIESELGGGEDRSGPNPFMYLVSLIAASLVIICGYGITLFVQNNYVPSSFLNQSSWLQEKEEQKGVGTVSEAIFANGPAVGNILEEDYQNSAFSVFGNSPYRYARQYAALEVNEAPQGTLIWENRGSVEEMRQRIIENNYAQYLNNKPKGQWEVQMVGGSGAAKSATTAEDLNLYSASGLDFVWNGTRSDLLIDEQSLGPVISFGARVQMSFGEKFSVSTGIDYYSMQVNGVSNGTAVDKVTGETAVYSPVLDHTHNVHLTNESYDINRKTAFVSVPVNAHWKFVDNKKLTVGVQAGVSFDFLTKANMHTSANYDVQTVEESVLYNKVALHSQVGMDLGYKINDKCKVSLVPSYKKALTPVLKEDSAISHDPGYFNIGLNLAYVIN